MDSKVAWKTHNFEVEGHHTYVADGIRVHNDSTWLGQVGDTLDNQFFDKLGFASDAIGDLVNGAFHAAGKFLGGVSSAAQAVANGFGNGLEKFQQGDIIGGIAEIGIGIATAIKEVVVGVFEAIGEVARGIGNAISSIFGGNDSNDGVGWDIAKPIILDLDGDGVELSIDGSVSFDMDDDGFLETTNWVGADDAFLVLDLNADGSRGVGDGKIDQTKEVVLAKWLEWDGATDLQALGLFDQSPEMGGNDDGVLSNQDSVWSEFRVWQDANTNGVVDSGELRTLNELGISEIALTYDDGTSFSDGSNDVTIFDSTLYGSASYVRNGATVTGGVGDISVAYEASGSTSVETDAAITRTLETGETQVIDKITSSEAADLLLANTSYYGAVGDNRANVISGAGVAAPLEIYGEGGDDNLTGGPHADVIIGGAGGDRIEGGYSSDLLVGGDGMDVITGGKVNLNDQIQFNVLVDSPNQFASNSGWGDERWEREIGDVDGDGYIDAVGFGASDTYVALGQADGSLDGAIVATSAFGSIDDGWGNEGYERRVADVNGDGRDDIVGFGYSKTYVSLGQANGTFGGTFVASDYYGTTGTWDREEYERRLADFNGDGRADIVAFGNTGVYTSFGAADGTFEYPLLGTDQFGTVTDYSGVDSVPYFWGNEQYEREVGDVNGDGYADLIGFGADGTYVSLSYGTGYFGLKYLATSDFGSNTGWGNEAYERRVEDVNSDGYADVIGFGQSATVVSYGRSDGTFGPSFVASESMDADIGLGAEQHERRIADVNGDGIADAVVFGPNGTGVVLGEMSDQGADRMFGGGGNDLLKGEHGADLIIGGEGSDTLEGGRGRDTLNGGLGADTLTGGSNDDVFVFSDPNGTSDLVSDFAVGIDTIDLRGLFHHLADGVALADAVTVANDSGDALIRFDADGTGAGTSVEIARLSGIDASGLEFGRDILLTDGVAQSGGDTNGGGGRQRPDDNTSINTTTYTSGGTGNDTLTGDQNGASADFLNGKQGSDTMIGKLDNDKYIVDSTGDMLVENAGEGQDAIELWTGNFDMGTNAANVEMMEIKRAGGSNVTGNSSDNIIKGHTGVDTIDGAAGDDLLIGNGADDILSGGAGRDWLVGGDGADQLSGGAGADVFVIDAASEAGDVVSDFAVSEDAVDVRLLVDQLPTGISAADAISISDNGGDAVIAFDADGTGPGGSVDLIRLTGVNAASLTLGTDIWTGQSGTPPSPNDAVGPVTDSNASLDQIAQDEAAGRVVGIVAAATDPTPTDTVSFGVDDTRFTVDADGVVRVASGATFDAVTEPSVDIVITASSSDGSSSQGTFTVDVLDPIRIEVEDFDVRDPDVAIANNSGASAGKLVQNTTTLAPVNMSTTYNGPSGVFDVVLGAYDENDGAGQLVMKINGVETLNTVLDQTSGDDGAGPLSATRLSAGTGITINQGDVIEIMAQRHNSEFMRLDYVDLIQTGGAPGGPKTNTPRPLPDMVDTNWGSRFEGGTGNDVITGDSGNNYLNGKQGADTAIGGLGDDVYMVYSAGDVVVEEAGEGTDRIRAGVDYTLPDHVETGSIESSNGRVLTGNQLDNRLDGKDGNDGLIGGDGDDWLIGGIGADTLKGETGADVFVYLASGQGGDIIEDFDVGTDSIDLRQLSLSTSDVTLSAIDTDGNGSNDAVELQVSISGVNETLATIMGVSSPDELDIGFDLWIV